MKRNIRIYFLLATSALFSFPVLHAQAIKDDFVKIDTTIAMRDGVRLYTTIYIPKDETQSYPFLMERTPYSCGPYGAGNYKTRLASNANLVKDKYIFVFQDVRGRYMSEGKFEEMTPAKDSKKSPSDVDESSDTYDTVDWLLKNIKNNNGRVGIYGISYPGFYATASLPQAHPAIKAVSPQAPVTDEFVGDDANHNGAFYLLDNFDFDDNFDGAHPGPQKRYTGVFPLNIKDAYQFFLDLGPVKNTNSPSYYNHKSKIWDEYLDHNTYDSYWKARNIRTHLNGIRPAVLVVGGWFDAEDMFGALRTYQAIEKQNPSNQNFLVMGPWTHGAWARGQWSRFGTHDFGSNTSKFFQDSIEARFFRFYLKDKGPLDLPEATIFETGSNVWKNYPVWPPAAAQKTTWYLSADKGLSAAPPRTKSYLEYVSDPSTPVPYTPGVRGGRNNEYMVEDQHFATSRKDVLTYMSVPLEKDMVVAGELFADLSVSLTGTDADFIVKLVDVLPDTAVAGDGLQRMVRAEVMRGKFRNNLEKPEPFVPGMATHVKLQLNDISHCFKKGHRLMVQVQSSWFPLVDMNPQTFVTIPEASASDFQKETIRVYGDSKIVLPVVNR